MRLYRVVLFMKREYGRRNRSVWRYHVIADTVRNAYESMRQEEPCQMANAEYMLIRICDFRVAPMDNYSQPYAEPVPADAYPLGALPPILVEPRELS